MTSVWQYMGKLGDKDRYKVTGITSFQCNDWVQKKKTSDINSLIKDIMKWKRGIFHLMFSLLLFFFFADFDQLPEVIILNSFSAYMCHDLMAKHLHGDGQRLAKKLSLKYCGFVDLQTFASYIEICFVQISKRRLSHPET